MSARAGECVVLAAEKPQQCDLCGAVAELRPYGPGGACICHSCAMKDRRGTRIRMGQRLFGLTEDEAARIADEMNAADAKGDPK